MPLEGKCALCGRLGKLLRSHVELPKFVYKRLRTEAARNPNPVQISVNGVRQTPRQQRRYLLCSKCENDRFNKLGESWIAKTCLQADRSFPLKELVLSAPHEIDGGDLAIYRTDQVQKMNHTAIEYFAASMVWRAQFLPRKPISLGEHEVEFRNYLLGLSDFPASASLIVAIRHRSNLTQVSHSVIEAAPPFGRSFLFYIPGLYFNIILEKNLSNSISRPACFVHSPNRIVLDSDVIDHDVHERITKITLAARQAGRPWRITDDSKPHHLLTPEAIKRRADDQKFNVFRSR